MVFFVSQKPPSKLPRYGWFLYLKFLWRDLDSALVGQVGPPGASAVPSPLWSHFHHDPGRVKIVADHLVDFQLPKTAGGYGYVLQNKHIYSIYILNICQTMFKTYNSWGHVIHRWFLDSFNRRVPKKRDFLRYIRRRCCVISLMSLKKSCILRSIKRPGSFYQHTPENTKA